MGAPLAIDVSRVDPDAGTVDALARLQLATRRVLLRNASHELLDLIAFMGLKDVLRLEPGGEAEERE